MHVPGGISEDCRLDIPIANVAYSGFKSPAIASGIQTISTTPSTSSDRSGGSGVGKPQSEHEPYSEWVIERDRWMREMRDSEEHQSMLERDVAEDDECNAKGSVKSNT